MGYMLIAMGAVVLLYILYSLLVTGLSMRQAQAGLRAAWEPRAAEASGPVLPGEALAVLRFARPGTARRPVQDGSLYVVEGVGVEDLKKGPGHYTGTALPGQPGNFAVAGHRTTYGNPFFDLDELQPSDQVWVTDRQGTQWVYSVVRQEVVSPDAKRVLNPDPLSTGRPTLTLTSCHPRFSNAQRLVIFAQLTTAPEGGEQT
ncbi:MAG: sortase [Egibacteraceae bacterium]